MKVIKMRFVHFLVGIFTIYILFEYSGSENGGCSNKSTCDDCIQTSGCVWCSKVKDHILKETNQFSVCASQKSISEVCEENFLENPKTYFEVIESGLMKNRVNGAFQLHPQEVSLKLKQEEIFSVDIEFRKSENYPVDLYYLMDFSNSMAKHKNNLSKLGDKLAETMKNLTCDFQLGFGSFVDKVVLPFTSTLPSHLKHPCPKCRSPYSYKNHMSLSNETKKFSIEVAKAQMSGNLDTPEGVLDSLMQVIVCQKQLNWRPKARHIIVVSTDAPFHLAGDGKLGGLIQPHDGECYVDEKGDYTHSLTFDYPSISQINYKALENNMNIIFAVVNKVRQTYELLSREIKGSSLGLLDAGENIADLIKTQYEKISTTIRLVENSQGQVKITFLAKCNKTEKWKISNECKDIKRGDTAYFKAHISVSDCSNKELQKQDILIKPVGINETLIIHFESICRCSCSATDHPVRSLYFETREVNSTRCSYAGDLVCGQCVCHEGREGKQCECSSKNGKVKNLEDTSQCISNNETNEICSGRGSCNCGICKCDSRLNLEEKIYGKYCECDNFSCEEVNGNICSGHGFCKCGKCICDEGWNGVSCECPLDDVFCKYQEEVCSGKGKCVCGICHCQNQTSEDHRYAGKYCQNCMTCMQHCDVFNKCVECLSHNSGPLLTNNCGNCSKNFHLNSIATIEGLEKNISGTICTSVDHLGCVFRYFYHNNNGVTTIWAEKNTICSTELNIIVYITGTIGGTVLVGLLSLGIWKVLTDIYDKKEYEKFKRELQKASWGTEENPLFKMATATYKNPVYVSDSYKLAPDNSNHSDPKEMNSSEKLCG